MLIDAKKLFAAQISAVKEQALVFEDGRSTRITPVNIQPIDNDANSKVSLSGEWKVAYWPFKYNEETMINPRTAKDGWETTIQPGKVFYANPQEVPGKVKNWNRVDLSHIDPDDGAIIHKVQALPSIWKGQRVYLRFNSIFPAGRIYLNGVLLGEQLSGLTAIDFDVTDKVKFGKTNHVSVRFLRTHDKVKIDMVRHALEFTGLAQEAFFHTAGQVQIDDYHLVAILGKNLKSGTLEGSVILKNHNQTKKKAILCVELEDQEGKPVARQHSRFTIPSSGDINKSVSLRIERPALWNDEKPVLYTVRINLKSEDQKTFEVVYRTGFRRFELSPKGCFLNGNPVKFRGVNHLTFHPEFGLHTPKEWLRENFSLMKKANVNAIRTHFTCPTDAAELCDEMGIYLLQELPIDWGTNYIHDVDWVGPVMTRLHAAVKRDRNHPSLMVWSVGNENMPESKEVADDGWHHLKIYDDFVKLLDPTRPTMFPPPGPSNKAEAILGLKVGDIADTHYSFKNIIKFNKSGKCNNPIAWDGTMEETSRQEALKRGWSGTWFSSEYGIANIIPDLLNAPYLSCLDDMEKDLFSAKNTQQTFIERLDYEWGMMRRDKCCLGGAYFPWLCAGAASSPEENTWGYVRWAEDADWGVITADLLPKSIFWAIRRAFSPVQFASDRVLLKEGEDSIGIEIWNGYNSINLKDCTLRTMMGGGGSWLHMMRDYKDIKINVKPGEKKLLKLPIWNKGSLKAIQKGSPICLRCIVLDPQKFRPITHDILVIPEKMKKLSGDMPVGPDAIF